MRGKAKERKTVLKEISQVDPYRLGFVAGRDEAIVNPENARGGLEGLRQDESDDWDREYSRGYADALKEGDPELDLPS